MIQVLAVESLSSPLKSAGAPSLHAIPDTHTRGARALGCVLPCPAFVPSGGAPIFNFACLDNITTIAESTGAIDKVRVVGRSDRRSVPPH